MTIKTTVARRLIKALSPEFARHPTHEQARQEVQNAYLQTEALLELRDRLPGVSLRGLRGYAISPDACLCLVELIEARRPALIVELGSGVSTVALAAAQDRWVAGGRVVSIDHEEDYASKTRSLLENAGLTNAEVRVAPLVASTGTPQSGMWYSLAAFDGLESIDMLFIDGPPAHLGRNARWPSADALAERISVDGCVALDDTDRADDAALAEKWRAVLDGQVDQRTTEKGLSIITRG